MASTTLSLKINEQYRKLTLAKGQRKFRHKNFIGLFYVNLIDKTDRELTLRKR